jgi:hypothetical protein
MSEWVDISFAPITLLRNGIGPNPGGREGAECARLGAHDK